MEASTQGTINLNEMYASNNTEDPQKAEFDRLSQEAGLTSDVVDSKLKSLESDPVANKVKADEMYAQLDSTDKTLQEHLSQPNNAMKLPQELMSGIARGGAKFIADDIRKTAIDVGNWIGKAGFGENNILGDNNKNYVSWDMSKKNPSEQIGMVIGRYVAPMLAVGPAAGGVGLAGASHTLATSIGASALTAVSSDPKDENLANILDSFPALHGSVTEYLMAKPEDTNVERRFKAGISSFLVDVLTLGTGKVLKSSASSAIEGVTSYFKGIKDKKILSGILNATEKLSIKPIVTGEPGTISTSASQITNVVDTAAHDVSAAKVEEYFNVSTPSAEQLTNAKPTKDVHQFIEDIGLKNDTAFLIAFEESKSGVIGNKEMEGLSSAIANDPKQMEKLWARTANTPISAPELVAMQKHVIAEKEILQKLIPKDLNNVTTENLFAIKNQLNRFAHVSKAMMSGGSEVGRALQSLQQGWKAAKSSSAKIAYMNEAVKLSGGNMQEAMYFIKRAEEKGISAEKIAASLTKKGITHKVQDIFWESTINAMFGIKTIMKNTIGNTLLALSAPARSLISDITMRVSGENTVFGAKAYAMLHGYNKALGEAFSTSNKAFWLEQFPKGMEKKWSNGSRALSVGNGDAWTLSDGWAKGIVNTLGYLNTVPSRALEAGDLFYGIIAREASIHAQSMEQAIEYSTISGIKTWSSDFHEFYNKVANNATNDMSLIADKFSKAQLLKSPLTMFMDGAEGSTQVDGVFMGKMFDNMAGFFKEAPFGRMFVPFVRINANMIDEAIQHVPGLHLMSPAFKSAIASGNTAVKHEAYSKIVLGSGLMAGAGWFVSHGLIEGDNNIKDYKLKSALGNTGTNSGISLDKLGVYGSILGMSLDIGNMMQHISSDDEHAIHDIALGSLAILADNLTPDFMAENAGSYFSKISDMYNGKINESQFMDFVGKQTVATLTPMHGIIKDINKATTDISTKDMTADKSKEGIDALWSGMKREFYATYPQYFGTGPDLPDIHNMFYEKIKLTPGSNWEIMDYAYNDKGHEDPVSKELIRLHMLSQSGYSEKQQAGNDQFTITKPLRYIKKGIGDGVTTTVQLDAKDYDKLQKYAAGIGLRGIDLTLKEQLAKNIEMFNSKGMHDLDRKIEIKTIINDYRTMAVEQLSRESENIIDKVANTMTNRDHLFMPTKDKKTMLEMNKRSLRGKASDRATPFTEGQ